MDIWVDGVSYSTLVALQTLWQSAKFQISLVKRIQGGE